MLMYSIVDQRRERDSDLYCRQEKDVCPDNVYSVMSVSIAELSMSSLCISVTIF